MPKLSKYWTPTAPHNPIKIIPRSCINTEKQNNQHRLSGALAILCTENDFLDFYQATPCSWLFFEHKVRQEDLQRSLPTWIVLWGYRKRIRCPNTCAKDALKAMLSPFWVCHIHPSCLLLTCFPSSPAAGDTDSHHHNNSYSGRCSCNIHSGAMSRQRRLGKRYDISAVCQKLHPVPRSGKAGLRGSSAHFKLVFTTNSWLYARV